MTRDLRMPAVAGAVWVTSLACVYVPTLALWAVLAGVLIGGAMGVVQWQRARVSVTSVAGGLIIVVLTASAAVALTVCLASPSREAARAGEARVVEAAGYITSSASIGRDGRLWIEVQLTEIGPPEDVQAVSAPARFGVEPAEGFDLGAGIRVIGEKKSTDAGERSAVIVFATTATVEDPAAGVFALAAHVRHAFLTRSLGLPEPGAGLLPGLAVGDTRAVSAELNDDMRASGLSHLTAVSGANCAIVVGAAFWVTALCGGGRRTRVIVAAVSLAGFVVLVTPEPSVIRAAIVAAVAMGSILLGRPSAGIGLLSLCATLILIVDPWLAATPGFALSVAASGALIVLSPPLAQGLERWLPQPIALALAVPLAAQLVCGPIIALFAEQQSLVGVAANIIVAPASPIATVIGLLACIAMPIPLLADLLAASAWLPAAWIASVAQVSASLPLAALLLPPGLASSALVAVMGVCVVVVLVRPHRGARFLRVAGWVRTGATGVIMVAVALGASHLALTGPLAIATTPDEWSLAFCDVGQGDAVVIRSEGETALIDTGPDPALLEQCLNGLGVEQLDILVLTHFDLDHIGGVSAVQGRVSRVLHGPIADAADERTLTNLAGAGAAVEQASAGREGTLGAAHWTVLWPQGGSSAFPAGNDASVVVEVVGGGVPHTLFLGDLSAESQRALARTARVVSGIAVVKVAHHGSADQDADLYARLRPAIAVISVGEENSYGHPRAETIAILQSTGARVRRTDIDGRVLIGWRSGALATWTEHSTR